MKTIMKSTLIASAIAATFGVQAAVIDAPANSTYSKQAQTFATASSITTTDLQVTIAAEYSENDTYRFYFENGVGELPTSFASLPSTILVQRGTIGTSDLVTMTLGKLTSPTGDDSEAHYRVTNVDNQFATGTGGLVIAFNQPNPVNPPVANTANLVIDSAAVVSGTTVKLCMETKTGVGAATIEKICSPVATVATQFNAVTIAAGNKLNGEIDVTMLREMFTGLNATAPNYVEANPTLEDTLVIEKAVVNTTGWQTTVTENEVTVVLNGDFTDLTSGQFTSLNALTGPTLNTAATQVTMTYPATFTTDSITFTSTGNGDGTNAELLDQKFTIDSEQDYTCLVSVPGLPTCPTANTGVETLNVMTDAGEWTLNGAQINIPYMPFSDITLPAAQRDLGQVIYITNHSSVDAGSVYVTATNMAGDVVLNNVVVESLGGNEMKKLTGKIIDALINNASVPFTSGKLSIDIVVNAADENISVHSAYKNNAETDRAVVINDQYKGKIN
ncbi:hypothetical protein [Litorilituus lipolyticus]|uniref:Uncharacterized protein n=1 Tax=Litorilituus lipolyticus TaxID=2491017 RepID=A0A502L5G0_9GAMM|nr:hypothetical protein [Litorilituus lipolyticus]TPH18966.1 hypothetical protein EPA86_01330 [Litorilituus lipolyticus]